MTSKERWASRIGLVLAMAGNAIGLGNFLRFPRLAAQYGGGAFLIPYFIALIVFGIPLMWLEWSMGRFGGRYGHNTTAGMFHEMWKSRAAKFIGSLGISLPLLFAVFYTYVESWTLAYSCFSVTRSYTDDSPRNETKPEKQTKVPSHDGGETTTTRQFLQEYQGVAETENRRFFDSLWPAIAFWIVTIALNGWVISNGLSGGIERLAKIAMPLLFLFASVLAVRVLTYGTPDPAQPDRSVANGLNYIWQPNFSALADFKVWLMAAGQIFFTLSIGTGTIQCFASYLKPDDDCALTGLTTATTNEFAEVVLGGTIAIPMAVATFGVATTQSIAAEGSFNLGFVAMPVIFEEMTAGWIFGAMWFLLLFFAGITSSVGMFQPFVSLLQDKYGASRRTAAGICAAIMLGLGLPVVLWLKTGYMDQFDFWIGTFGLVVLALAEVVVFAWLYRPADPSKPDRRLAPGEGFWREMTHAAEIRIPGITYYLLRYFVPLALVTLLAGWTVQSFREAILLEGTPVEHQSYLWAARGCIVAVVVAVAVLVRFAGNRKSVEEESS